MLKCQYGRNTIRCSGHVIGGGQVGPDPQKLDAVKAYPIPKDKKEVRAFLDLARYYRHFVPHFSTIADPLTELTQRKNPNKVKWNDKCEVAFNELKDHLVVSPVLKVVEPDEPYILQTNPSKLGLGVMLSQLEENGEEHPVALASRKLLPREKNNSVIEKECLTIVWLLQVFHVYLFSQKFINESNHQPLSWLQRIKNTSQHLTRWILAVQPYCLEIRHCCGCLNRVLLDFPESQ